MMAVMVPTKVRIPIESVRRESGGWCEGLVEVGMAAGSTKWCGRPSKSACGSWRSNDPWKRAEK
jgi:hypothetical protein